MQNFTLASNLNWYFLLETKSESIFLYPFWRYFEAIKKNLFLGIGDTASLITANELAKIIAADMSLIILEIVKRTLVWEFNLCIRKNAKLNLVEFIQNISSEHQVNILFNKYPMMNHFFHKIINNYRCFTMNLFTRLVLDFPELSRTFNLNEFKLSNFKIVGDPHCQGNRVALLSFRSPNDHQPKTVVYKSRDLNLEKKYNDFLAFLKILDRKINLKQAIVIPKKNYGWMEYIAHQPIQDCNVERYYYNVGMLLGVCYILNGQDMHYENVIACGENPVLIDLECLFSPPITQKQYKDFNFPAITETLLIPFSYEGVKNRLDVSALLNHDKQQSIVSNFIVKGNFINEVYIEREPAIITPDKNLLINPSNRMVYSPSEYKEVIAEGYCDFISSIIHHKNSVKQFITNQFSNLKNRVIFRPTFLYFMLLLESFHPRLLSDKKIYYNHLSQLINISSEANFSFLYEHEMFDLLNGDIPFFSSYTTETLIENSKCIKIAHRSLDTGLCRVLRKIDNLCNIDLTKDRDTIHSVLKECYV